MYTKKFGKQLQQICENCMQDREDQVSIRICVVLIKPTQKCRKMLVSYFFKIGNQLTIYMLIPKEIHKNITLLSIELRNNSL